MDTFAFNAIDLGDRAVLTPMTDGIVLNEPTRGIFARNASMINVTNDLVFTMQQRMTYAGALTKIGTGRLRLGGLAPRFTTDQLETPLEGTNILNIANGSLTPFSDTAFKGLVVNFAAGTSLVLEHPSALSADAARYGMRLTDELSALNIADAKLTVTMAPTTSKKGGITAICTVPKDSAATYRNKFNVSEQPYGDVRVAKVVELANDDDTVTFAVRLYVGTWLMFK